MEGCSEKNVLQGLYCVGNAGSERSRLESQMIKREIIGIAKQRSEVIMTKESPNNTILFIHLVRPNTMKGIASRKVFSKCGLFELLENSVGHRTMS